MTEKTKIRIVEEPKRQELIQTTYGMLFTRHFLAYSIIG